jgi:hypothetical protein
MFVPGFTFGPEHKTHLDFIATIILTIPHLTSFFFGVELIYAGQIKTVFEQYTANLFEIVFGFVGLLVN